MTLNTAIFLQTTESPEHIANIMREIIGGFSGVPAEKQIRAENKDGKSFGNRWAQGLCAALDVTAEEQPRVHKSTSCKDIENCDIDGYHGQPAHNVQIRLDTTYSFDYRGMNCSQLHAAMIVMLREKLKPETKLWWDNEFTGEIFEELDGLDAFTKSGKKAAQWFDTTVRPLLMAQGARLL